MQLEWLMLRAGLRALARHPLQLILLILGLSLGIAVVTAVQLSTGSARESYSRAVTQLTAGASHRIQSQAGIPEQLYVQLRTAPQQWQVLPVVTFKVRLETGAQLSVYGLDLVIDPRLQSAAETEQGRAGIPRLSATEYPAVWLSAQMADSLGLKVADTFEVVTESVTETLQLAGSSPMAGDWLLMDIGDALQLSASHSGPAMLSYLDLIVSEAQAQALSDMLLHTVQLVALTEDVPGLLQDALYFNLNAMALLALVMGGLVVFSTIRLSIRQRQPLFASWRLAGLSNAQLIAGVLVEIVVIALIAALLGILLGHGLAHYLLPLLVESQAAFQAPPLVRLTMTIADGMRLVLLTIAAALLAAAEPCWRLAQQSPLLLLNPPPPQLQTGPQPPAYRGIALSLVVMVISVALFELQTLPGLYLALVLLTLLFAAWAGPVHRILCRCLSRQAGPWPLVQMVLRDGLRRQFYSSGVILVLLLTLSSAVALQGMTSSFHRSFERWIDQRLSADLYVGATDGEGLERLAAQLSGQSDIRIMDRRWRAPVSIQGRSLYLYGGDYVQPAQSGYTFLAGDSSTLWQRLQQQPVVLISEPLAHHLSLTVGDRIQPLAGGPALEIVGIYYDYGSYQGQMLVGAATFSQLYPDQQIRGLRLWLAEKAEPEALIKGPLLQPFKVQTSGYLRQRTEALFEQTFLITDVLQALLLAVALVAMATNLLVMQLARRAELQRLRALGMPPLVRAGLLLAQALLLALSGALLAVVLGELLAWLLTEHVQKLAFGWSIPWHYSFLRSAMALLAGLLVALLAALYPAFGQEVSDEN